MKLVDKQSYKDQYHFNYRFPGSQEDDHPSVEVEPKINTSIKKNTERSNVEIEKDEVVLQPDLSALFKARGKKHKNGGIEVNLQPNSFIFSDDPSMHFTEKEHELFEFKMGGKFNKLKSTPADVLKRNVDVKHYNKMVNNLKDDKKDDISKRSSSIMLQKYLDTLGNVAFLQEKKKDFPDGLPDISQDTAPIYDANLKEKIVEQKQYAKYGGKIKMQWGGPSKGNNKPTIAKDPQGNRVEIYPDGSQLTTFKNGRVAKTLPDGSVSVGWVDATGNFNPDSHPRGATTSKDPYRTYPGTGYTPDTLAKEFPAGYRVPTTQTSNQPPQGTLSGVPFTDTPEGTPGITPRIPNFRPPSVIAPPEELPLPIPAAKPPLPSTPLTNVPDEGYNPNWDFSQYQRESQGYNLLKLASAKRYMPYRSRFQATYVDPALVNPEQAVGDVRAATNSQMNAVNSLNPILRNAQASSAFGEYIDKIPGIRSQYDNQNAQILNQTRGMNTQIRNQETGQNIQNDQNYYKESVIGQQNFDNLRTFMGDQYMNNRMQDVQDNQALAYTLLQQDNPAYIYDYRTGQFKPNPKRNILNVKGNQTGDYLQNFLDQLDKAPISEEKKWELKSKITTGKYLGSLSQ